VLLAWKHYLFHRCQTQDLLEVVPLLEGQVEVGAWRHWEEVVEVRSSATGVEVEAHHLLEEAVVDQKKMVEVEADQKMMEGEVVVVQKMMGVVAEQMKPLAWVALPKVRRM
jgi:hypothetical protein